MARLFKVIALVAMLILITAGTAAATHGNPTQEVAITGYSFGTDTMSPPDAGCAPGDGWRYQDTGTGVLAHLGAVEVLVSHCSRFTGPTTGTAGPGVMTMTAANGDRLFFAETATFELTFGPSGPVASAITLEWQITGGTGRFAHAAGSGGGSGLSLIANGTTSMTYWGSISYDGADRAD